MILIWLTMFFSCCSAGLSPDMLRLCIAGEFEAVDTDNKTLNANEGQADLDAAIEQKLSAQSLDDFERVIDLCRRAIRKGLPEDSKDFANNLIVGTLIDRSRCSLMPYLMLHDQLQTGHACDLCNA